MNEEKSKFYGRRDELLFLLEAWGKAKVGNPYWVAYNAETGVGKTRLIQEFYQLLSDFEYQEKFLKTESNNQLKSENYDPNNYWPNSLPIDLEKLGLNPKSENFETALDSSELNIPWLWWGIRGIDSNLRNGKEGSSALSDGLEHFHPHMEPLVNKRIRRDSNLAATTEVLKKVANLATGGWLDTFIGIGELAVAGKEPWLRLFNQPELQTIFEQRKKQKNQLSDMLQDAVFKFLGEQVPVILILDDAQWLDKDTIDFIDKLVHKLSNQPMKLIIVSTGWAKEWKEGSPIKAVFDKFNSKRFERTLFGIEPEHAEAFLLAHFQGLSESDILMLKNRADGNWRYLTELVMALKKDKTYFEGKDCLARLSESGRNRIASKLMDMDSLIESRFLDFDESVQSALERSSYQGIKFDPKLTSEVTGQIDSSIGEPYTTVTEAINQAENPGSMVSSSDGMLKEFLQGPYWRFVNSRLKASDEFKAVEEAYKSTIENLNGDETLSAIHETMISHLYSFELDTQKKMKMLGLLIHNLTQKRRYQAGCQYIEDLHRLVEDDSENLDHFSTKATCSSLRLISYFGFSSKVYNSLETIEVEKLGEKLACKFQGMIFELESDKNVLDKAKIVEAVECCEVLLQFRTAFGHTNHIVDILRMLIDLQELYLKFVDCPSQASFQIIANRIYYCEKTSAKALKKESWDSIFVQYQMALSDLTQLNNKTEVDILRSWVQISVLLYGQHARKYYPKDTLWGDDYKSYCVAVNKLGDILYEIEINPTIINELGGEVLKALILAGGWVVEYSLQKRFLLAPEFVDRLEIILDEIFQQSENGAYISQELIEVSMNLQVSSADFMQTQAGVKHSYKFAPEVDISSFKNIILANRVVNENEAVASLDRCLGMSKRYMGYGVFTMPIIVSYGHAINLSIRLKSKSDEVVVSDFNQLLEYASLCRDGYRASVGELVQLLPSLIDIYDYGLQNSPHKEECWESLRECYKYLEDHKFDTLVSQIRGT